MALARFAPAVELLQLVEEAVVFDPFEESHHVGMRTDDVGDVEQRQTHLGGHVVGGGPRERVGHVRFAEPLAQVLVEPERRVHRGHEHLTAARVEQQPFEFLEIGQDEVEQLGARPRSDVSLQGGDRCPVLRDEFGDDRRVRLDRDRVGNRRRRGQIMVVDLGDEVPPVEDGLERVGDERIRPAEREEPGTSRRRREERCDVDEETTGGGAHRCRCREQPHREPERFHGVGHHLLVADGHVDVVRRVVDGGDGEQRGDRPALDDDEVVVDQAPFDVLGRAEVRFDAPTQRGESHDLLVGQRGLVLLRRFDRAFLCPARRRGVNWRSAWWRSSCR